MSRTFSTRWLIPEGLTASVGAAGTSEILSVIAALPNLGLYLVLPRDGPCKPSWQIVERNLPARATLGLVAVNTIFLGIRYLQKPKAGTLRFLAPNHSTIGQFAGPQAESSHRLH